jgi:hypothetical protein
MSVCYDLIRGAYGEGGDKLSDVEIAALQKTLAKKARELKARDPGLSDNDSLIKAGDELATNVERAALVKKRNEYLGLKSYLVAIDTIRTQFGDNYAEGLKAFLVGVQSRKIGARASAANEIETLERQYFGGVLADIKAVDGGLDILAAGTMDREIARALSVLEENGTDLAKFDVRAVGIAKAIRKWQEAARYNANRAGAWIGKDAGYITKQSHDSLRISKDRDGWLAMMREKADLPRMMDETGAESVDELLGSIWDALASGLHLKSVDMSADASRPGLRGMARGVSQERVIHFKSADDWMDYNEAFGGGNLREAVLGSFKNLARATGLMRVMGPNHESTFKRIVDTLQKELRDKDPVAAGKFAQTAERYKNWYLKELDGSLDVPGNNTLASFSAGVRAWQNMASLGGSVLSSVGDLGVMMVGAKHLGDNGFSAVGKGLANLFTGVPSAEKLALYADLGLAMESMIGKFATSRFSVDDGVRGAVGQMQKLFFTLNLQNRWTDSMRSSIAEFVSLNLARRVDVGFDGLDASLRSTMTLYGIDSGKWDIIRSGALAEVEGRNFLTPSAVADIADERFAAYLESKGQKPTAAAIREVKGETERQLRGLFVDQNGYMLLTPDAATRGIMKGGTQKGTAWGEAVRFMMQFKSFTVAFSQRVIGREAKQNGLAGVARMIAWTTLAGYGAMSLKDLAKGKEQRPFFDPRTAMAAFQNGGGAGIYGDVLFSQLLDRRAQDAFVNLLGPTVSDANEVVKLGARVIQGQDPAAAAVRLVQSNTPFANLFYTKLALDYMIFWNLQEAMNPGSLARMEREMEQRTGQTTFISPSRDRFQPE